MAAKGINYFSIDVMSLMFNLFATIIAIQGIP